MTLSRHSDSPWYENRQRLAALADWLKEQGREPDDWAYFIGEPWKWDDCYQQMLEEEREEERARVFEEERAFESERRYAP